MLGNYTKAIVGGLLSLTLATQVALIGNEGAAGDGRIDGLEWAGLVVTLLGVGTAILGVRNADHGWRYWAKAIVAGLGASLGNFVTALAGSVQPGVGLGELVAGVSAGQWLLVVIGLLNAIPVGIAPNAAASDNLIVYPDDEVDLDDAPTLPADSALPPRPPGFDNPPDSRAT